MKDFFEGCINGLLDEESGFCLASGSKRRFCTNQGVEINEYAVREGDIKSSRFLSGNYIIAQTENASNESVRNVLGKELKKLLRESGKNVLCCGIGNPYMTSDSLGVETVKKLMKNRKKKLKLLIPLLEGLTGISSGNVLKNAARSEGIDTVIIIDSLATGKAERIGLSYQLSDAGIVPGSAMGARKNIDDSFLGVKTFAIGVPTVYRIQNDGMRRENMFTPKDIDLIIEKVSENICKIIEKALY